MNSFNLGKYKVIVISIAFFLVFDLGVLVLNFYISTEIAKDATEVNLSGRQRMLTQRMTKSLYDIKTKSLLAADYSASQTELKNTFNLFDQTIIAFRDGGAALGADGSDVVLDQIIDAEGVDILNRSFEIWDQYKTALTPLVESDGLIFSDQLSTATDSAAENNVPLLVLMNDFTVYLENKATGKANFLRMVQVTGISLATINFIIILFHFIRKLRENDNLLEEAKNETDEILETVSEGLFLLNQDYSLGSQYSRELENIFQSKHLNGLNFKRFLSRIVPDKTLQTAIDYIDLLFGDRVNEKLVESLNPLDKVEVFFNADDANTYANQFLSFKFNRVFDENQISHLLVTVTDITKQVQLENELQAAEEKSKEQLNLLTEVLPMDSNALIAFLDNSETTLGRINEELKSEMTQTTSYDDKLDAIFRLMHRLKGDASAIGFRFMEKTAHNFEKNLVHLKEIPNLSGNDFLPLAVELETFYRLIESVKQLLSKLGSIRNAVSQSDIAEMAQAQATEETVASPQTSEATAQWKDLEKFTNELATKHAKKARLDLSNFQLAEFAACSQTIRDLLIQFIRNSVSHGIELPMSRADLNKNEMGTLKAEIKAYEDGSFDFIFEDDGAGINLEKIKAVAIDKGYLSSEDATSAGQAQLIKLLFKPGFSTAETIDEDAGRGVGMDIVKELVAKLSGKLRVATAFGKYCRFTVHVPAASTMQAQQVA